MLIFDDKHVNSQSWVKTQSKVPIISLSKILNPHCLVLVGDKNRFKREFTVKLK